MEQKLSQPRIKIIGENSSYSLEVSVCAMSDEGCFSSTITVCSGDRVRCSDAEMEGTHEHMTRRENIPALRGKGVLRALS